MKLKIVIFVLLILFLAGIASPQFYFYGKNKVRQTSFNWKIIRTEHFNLHYYTSNMRLIKQIAQTAEETYARISKFLNIQADRKIPIIFYRTHIDFEQTNLYPGFLPPGALAFAEPIGHRVVLQGDMSEDELMGTLVHELGHIFEYAAWYQNISRSVMAFRTPPLWVAEGFADFITGGWGSFQLLTVRDAVINDQIPILTKGGQLVSAYGTARQAYDFGHFMMDFVHEKFGDRGVRNLVYHSRRGGMLPKRRNIASAFGMSVKMFNYEFKKYARDRFRKFIYKENPEEYSYMIGPEFPFIFSFSHQISPTGEMMAVMTGNMKMGDLDIILISMKDGKTIKNITPGITKKYDSINLKFNPADGRSFAWDQKGEKIVFFARRELATYILLIDVLDGKILKEILIKGPQDPTSPDFHPDGRRVFFTGIENTRSFGYSIDLVTGELRRHTEGRLFIRGINISPDGNRVAFSAKDGDFYKIYLAALDKPEMAIRLTSGNFNDITPQFSEDSRYIFYSSDELESYNIYAIDLKEKNLYRYTDVKTGNFFPTQIPGENELVISSYYKNRFLLFKKNIDESLEQRKIEFEDFEPLGPLPEKEPEVTILSQEKYKPFSKLYLTSLPPVTLGYSTDGSFLASTQLQFTDLMGDQNFLLYMASAYGYTNFNLYYLNMTNRLQYYVRLFYYREPYYYSYYDPLGDTLPSYLTLRKRYGGDFAVYFTFSRAYRAEVGFSLYRQDEFSDYYFYGTDLPYGQFFDGMVLPLNLSLVGETTRFARYGPNMGHTFKLSFSKTIKVSDSFMDSYTIMGDIRKYFRIDNNTLLAFRFWGYSSGGDNPMMYYIGGNNTIRSAPWRTVTGNQGFFFNAEFRFPLISAARTLVGTIGPVRGTFFFDVGGAWFTDDSEYRFFEEGKFRLKDGYSSYGAGIQLFLFGAPLHFEWVYAWDFREKAYYGFNFWLGLDF